MPKLLKQEFIEGNGTKHTTLFWWCPGCESYHGVSPEKHTWNGSMDKPTFTPSLLCSAPTHTPPKCHSYITDGIIDYLSDCEHHLAGKKVPLPDFPDDELEWITRE